MICNHCTMDRRGMMMYRTSNGYICDQCREEIKYAQAYMPPPDDELDADASSEAGGHATGFNECRYGRRKLRRLKPMNEYTTDDASQQQAMLQEEEQMSNHFAELAQIDVSKYIEKKGNLSYLSWAWAVDQLLRRDPSARWEYAEPIRYGDTMMVVCTVTAFGKSMTMQLPVMDHRNKAIPNPDAFAVNTAMQRCLVKAIALHGLGLYVYAGEDLPRTEEGDKPEHTPAEQIALQELRDAAINGTEALQIAWEKAGKAMRLALAGELASLKQAAAEAERKAA